MALNWSTVLSGPVFCAGVDWPYAVVVPNWNETLTEAPSGLTDPLTVAESVDHGACGAGDRRAGLICVREQAPRIRPVGEQEERRSDRLRPGRPGPSLLNGLAVQAEEIGSRTSA